MNPPSCTLNTAHPTASRSGHCLLNVQNNLEIQEIPREEPRQSKQKEGKGALACKQELMRKFDAFCANVQVLQRSSLVSQIRPCSLPSHHQEGRSPCLTAAWPCQSAETEPGLPHLGITHCSARHHAGELSYVKLPVYEMAESAYQHSLNILQSWRTLCPQPLQPSVLGSEVPPKLVTPSDLPHPQTPWDVRAVQALSLQYQASPINGSEAHAPHKPL